MRGWLADLRRRSEMSPGVGRALPVLIRRVGEDDVAAVRRMLVATWHATYDAWIGPETVREVSMRWHSHQRLVEETLLPHAAFLIALAEPRKAGSGVGEACGVDGGACGVDGGACGAGGGACGAGGARIVGTAFAYLGDATVFVGEPARAAGAPPRPSWPRCADGSPTAEAAAAPGAGPLTSATARSASAATWPTEASLDAAAPHVEIGRLYTAVGAQGRGVGQALVGALMNAFPANARYRLDVDPRNERAIAFYRRNGFVVIDEGEDCGGSGLQHLVMERRLPPGST